MQYKRFLSCLLGAALFLSCVKEPVSTVDPLPFPMDGNKDLSVAPGDDFFRYCNGGWQIWRHPKR